MIPTFHFCKGLTVFERPDDIDMDLHFVGSKIKFMDFANFSTFEIMRWWVLELDVIILKSSANGVHITGVSQLRWYPCLVSESIYSKRGLKTHRKIVGDRGSPWNTPRLKMNGSELHVGPQTVPLIFAYNYLIYARALSGNWYLHIT